MKTNLLAAILAALIGLPAVAQVKDYREIQYPSLPEFKIPQPTEFTLNNGMRVFLMEDHELPLIRINARIRTGSRYEPSDKVGLAGLMGAVQRSGGAGGMTGDQIDDFLAARAASIETGMGGDAGYASMDCLKPDFDDVFKVFNDVLRSPAFAQDKLDIAKVSENSQIARRNDDIGGIASREITRLVYGPDSPLARNTEYATIKSVTREDLVGWHKKYYQPNSVFLGVVGDFDTAGMRKKIEAAFDGWQKGSDFSATPVVYRQEPAPGLYFIEKSDVNQVNLAFGHLGIETRNPDYFAVQVMNEVLGGGFASRMFSNVRSQKGLAYSVYGRLGAEFTAPGMFEAGLQTKSGNLTKAIEAMKAEIAGIIDHPATAEELKRAKDSILNSFIFNYDSKRKVLSQQMTYVFYGLPSDFLEQYRANIEKVNAGDVARVAKKYVHPDQLAILVVGKSAEFDQPLASLGKVTPINITIPPPPDTAPKAEKTAATEETGKKVWAQVVRALGGEALQKTDAIKLICTVALKIGEQSVSLKQDITMAFPDKFRLVMATPMGEQTIVVVGNEGFAKMGDKVTPLPEEAIADQAKERSRSLTFLLRYNDDAELQVLANGEEKIDGTNCQILALSRQGVESRLWVAPDGKVVKQTYQGAHPVTRAPGAMETLMSDYRAEGPFWVAHKIVQRMEGQDVMTVTLETFEANPKIDPEIFKKPVKQ
jgi:predicted Zn-dependent peptidase